MSIPHHDGSGPRTVLLTHGWFGSSLGMGAFPPVRLATLIEPFLKD